MFLFFKKEILLKFQVFPREKDLLVLLKDGVFQAEVLPTE